MGGQRAGFCRSRCNGRRRSICRFLRFVGIERNGLWAGPAPRLLGLAKFGRGPARPDFEVGLAGHVESPLRRLGWRLKQERRHFRGAALHSWWLRALRELIGDSLGRWIVEGSRA